MQVVIKRKTVTVADFAEASRVYCDARKKSGQGARSFPDADIFDNGEKVARISYNGNVWAPAAWTPGATPLLRVAGLFA